MRVGIVAQKGNDHAASLAAELRRALESDDVDVAIDAATASALDATGIDVDRMSECDLVVSIGGDGTFLFAAHGAESAPILGVNLGEVGFLNAVGSDDAVEAVREEVAQHRETGTVRFREAPRLRAEGENGWTIHPALNEIVVQGAQRGHGNGVDYEIRVNGQRYTADHGDGVLVSTPTGSTAYNLSEGGPLLRPDVDGLVITEMCATESMPPLVVDTRSEISIEVSDASFAFVSSDSTRKRIETPELVTVSAAESPARIAGQSVDFFQALDKLD